MRQGDSVLILSPSGQSVLYDGGTRASGAGVYARRAGVETLDLAIASHADADHIGGLIAAVRELRPRFFLDNAFPHTTLTYADLIEAVRAAGSILLEPSARTIGLGAVSLRILPPPGEPGWGQNHNSVGVIVEFGEFRAGLTGDAGSRQLGWWIGQAALEPVHVYKSSHHGSATGDTPETLAILQPEVVVISVGAANPFGHPAAEALARYAAAGARVYRTDLNGTVIVRARSDGSYLVTVERGEATLPAAPAPAPAECCRTCRAGKPCGDTCIAAHLECTRPPGCACPGAMPTPPQAGLPATCLPAL